MWDDGMRVVECPRCRFVYCNPVPDLAELANYYTESYADTDRWRDTFRHDRSLVFSKGLQAIRRVQPRGRLLDVGCSLGWFLVAARHVGYETYGVEIAHSAASFARREFRLRVHEGTLATAPFPEQYFHVITLWDVLEHLDDPDAALRKIRQLIRPDGVLLIRVPNITFHLPKAHLVRRLFPGRAIGLDAWNHLNHYSSRTLTLHLARHGFRTVWVRPGIPNVYGKPVTDSAKMVYTSICGLLGRLGTYAANIIEVLARPDMSGNRR